MDLILSQLFGITEETLIFDPQLYYSMLLVMGIYFIGFTLKMIFSIVRVFYN